MLLSDVFKITKCEIALLYCVAQAARSVLHTLPVRKNNGHALPPLSLRTAPAPLTHTSWNRHAINSKLTSWCILLCLQSEPWSSPGADDCRTSHSSIVHTADTLIHIQIHVEANVNKDKAQESMIMCLNVHLDSYGRIMRDQRSSVAVKTSAGIWASSSIISYNGSHDITAHKLTHPHHV